MNDYECYARIRDNKGLKDANVAKLAGIPASSFTDWRKDKSKPKREKMQKIATVLGVPVDYLVTGDAKYLVNALVKEDDITLDEIELIKAFRKCDDLTQQMILRLLGIEKRESSSSLKEA